MLTPRQKSVARTHQKRYANGTTQTPDVSKSRGAGIAVKNELYNFGNFNPYRAAEKGKSISQTKFGGRLNPRQIPTYPSPKYGRNDQAGVFASGRKAKATGFGSEIAMRTIPVGARQVLTPVRSGRKYW